MHVTDLGYYSLAHHCMEVCVFMGIIIAVKAYNYYYWPTLYCRW